MKGIREVFDIGQKGAIIINVCYDSVNGICQVFNLLINSAIKAPNKNVKWIVCTLTLITVESMRGSLTVFHIKLKVIHS